MNGRQENNEKRETRNEIRPNTCYALRVTRYSLLIVFLFLSFVSVSHAAIWTVPTSGTTESLNDVNFYDDLNGFAVGEDGAFCKTTDGGTSWTYVGGVSPELAGDATAMNVFMDSSTSAFIIARTTKNIYRFENNAFSVAKVLNNFANSGGIFLRGQNIYVVGIAGTANFIKSTDNGSTWTGETLIGSASDAFTSVYFIDGSTGWACGYKIIDQAASQYKPAIWKTTDGGATWSNVYLGSVTTQVLSVIEDIYAINQNIVWACGWDNKIRKSTDGGTNWTTYDVESGNPAGFLENIRFIDQNIGWISSLGVNPGVYRTVDGGATWSRQIAANSNALDILPTSKKPVAVGQAGGIAKLSTPQLTSFSKTSFARGTTETITAAGLGFENPSISFSKSGITAESVTATNSSELRLTLKVYDVAELGAVAVTITNNIDATATTEASVFTVTSNPTTMTITSINPNNAYPSEHFTGAVNGTNILNPGGASGLSSAGFSVFASNSGTIEVSLGSGVTIQSVSWLSNTQIEVTGTIDATATAGTRDLTVTIKGPTGEVVSTATKTAAFTVSAVPEPGTLPDAQSILPKIGNSGVWNPKTDGDLPVQVKVPIAGSYNIMVANESGIMYKTIKNFNVGYNTIVIPSKTELANGVHVLIFQDPSTGKTIRAKFAVNQ